MKKFLLASTVAIAALTTGFAATAQSLSENTRLEIMQLVPDADLTGLTSVQEAQLMSLFSTSGRDSNGDDPAGAVKAILDGSSSLAISQQQLSTGQKAQIRLVLPQVADADLENLSTAQFAELSGLFSSDGTMMANNDTPARLSQILMGSDATTLSQSNLSAADQLAIMQLVPDAKLDALTTAQYAELTTFLSNSDNLRAGNSPAGRIRNILGM